MAKAANTTITETKVVEVPAVTLTLTKAEAAVVHAAVGAVGGFGEGRRIAGEVFHALSGKTQGEYYADKTILITFDPWA